jgi:PTH1 family peptidyl-tRNA hydrolase
VGTRTSRVAYLAVGLSNPGSEYAGTRHNVGGSAVALVAARHAAKLRRERGLSAAVAEVTSPNGRVALAVPETYMNDSGAAVGPLVKRYLDGGTDRLIVVHDELDLEPGTVRVKIGGGTAGHNGLKSIHQHLGTLEFIRVRIGIGKPPGRSDGARYVLGRPGKREQETLDVSVEIAADAIWKVVEQGPDVAMNEVNRT